MCAAGSGLAQSFNEGFDNGAAGWQTVVDGVMGGRSTARVDGPGRGTLRFTGVLSLENNGGFSQARTSVNGGDFVDADGIELVVRGDGRTYNFDIRLSNVRMMGGSYQQTFDTKEGEWTVIRLPFDGFRAYSFGRLVSNAPKVIPANIESLGFTLSDKKPGPFQLDVDAIRAYADGAVPVAQPSGNDLVSVAENAGLTTLLQLVRAAELELPDEPVTIFAPTNEAFAALDRAQVEALLRPSGRETLRAILSYHITPSAISSSDLLARRTLTTANGQRVPIRSDGVVSIGKAKFVATDVPFDGGTVHVIDSVMMPALAPITELAASTTKLSTLVAAIEAAGIGDQLGAENGPWTVFAPVNSAFEALPEGALDELLEPQNRRRLIAVLGLHVVPGRVYANELLVTRQSQTFFGEPVAFGIENGRLRVNGANFIATDIEASNGVVHLIDSVLLPGASESGPETVSAAQAIPRLYELAVNRGAPLFNDGQPAACAAIYEITIEAILALGGDAVDRTVIERLRMGLAEAEQTNDPRERAWIYRRALDETYSAIIEPQERPRQASSHR